LTQEKLEGVINLPESLEVTKSILSFLYTTSYTEEGTATLKHSAGVYIAAYKYDIPALKTLAFDNLTALFRSLESLVNPEHSKSFTPGVLASIEKFLEVVVLLYDTTEDTDVVRSGIISTAREILRFQEAGANKEAWAKCFGMAPLFALDLVKPNSISPQSENYDVVVDSRRWRAARDCVIFECGQCSTAVIMSKETWEDCGHERVGTYTRCPNGMVCNGKLEYEIPSY